MPRTGGQAKGEWPRKMSEKRCRLNEEWGFCYQCDGKPSECFHQREKHDLIYIFKSPLGKMYCREKTR